jgi:hypothetical protein
MSIIPIGQKQLKLSNTYLPAEGSFTINLSHFATPQYRAEMKIPDTVLGHQWAIADAQGRIFTVGEFGGNVTNNAAQIRGIPLKLDSTRRLMWKFAVKFLCKPTN